MKKLSTILALAISTAAFAGSVSIEGAKIDTVSGADQNNVNFTLSETISQSVAAHVNLSSTQTETSNSVNTRLEAGVTNTTRLVGSVNGYVKFALGQKYSTSGTGNFTYYSVEPGVSVPLTDKWTAKAGYRYRSAAFDALANKDTTETARLGVAYSLTKADSVGFRFDRITGDSTQDAYNVFYSRSF
jgi:opacity protein-like surface antigen